MKNFYLVLISVFVVVALTSCGGAVSDQSLPIESMIAEMRDNDAFIQVDWIEIGEFTGDRFGRGELSVVVYVIRQDGRSLQLVMPDKGSYSIPSSNRIELAEFGVMIENVTPGESILLYLFAFDRDAIEVSHNQQTAEALDEGRDVLAGGFSTGLLSGRTISQTGIRTFILTEVSEDVRKWWGRADFLGGNVWVVEPASDWIGGKAYSGSSDNDNLDAQIIITAAADFKFTDATPTTVPTLMSTPVVPVLIEITPQPTYIIGESFECEDAFEPRLEIGGYAKVVVYQVTVRRMAGLYAAPLNYFARDRILLVEDGPVCLDGLYWWKVESEALDYGGWVAEADDENYFLEPSTLDE